MHVDESTEAILVMQGTPDELDTEMDTLAGFTVSKVTLGGQHDGHEAAVIALSDSMGKRPIGRLVVRTDVPYQEECLTWERDFGTTAEMREFIERHDDNSLEPVTTFQDFCWDGYPSLAYGMATMAAEFGVSITIHRQDAGSGWPEIQIVGQRRNVIRALTAKNGWNESLEEARRTVKPLA